MLLRRFPSRYPGNGSELLDLEAMKKSALSKKQRTRLFYAHAYASWERGSNENGNRMIRRFIAKGRNIATFSRERIRQMRNRSTAIPVKYFSFKAQKKGTSLSWRHERVFYTPSPAFHFTIRRKKESCKKDLQSWPPYG
jgi:hypothetical protein